MLTDRIPPQAVEVEESILAWCIINDPTDAIELLTPDHFYKTANSKIFDSIANLKKNGSPVDILTLMNSMKESGILEESGGAAYLYRLLDCPIPAANIEHYAGILKDKATLRNLIAKSSEIMSRCYDDNGDVEVILDDAQKNIMDIDYGNADVSACKISSVLDDVIDSMETSTRNQITGIRTGMQRLDLLLGGLQQSDMIVLGGRPSMGKTSFSLNIVERATVQGGIPSAMWSLEMSKQQLTKRMIAIGARIDGGKFLSNAFHSDEWSRITDAAGRLNDAPFFIDDRPSITHMELRRSMRKVIKNHGIKFAIIDYLQLMQGDSGNGRFDEISSISRSIKALAKEFCIPIIAISQLSRKLEDRSNKEPILSDLRESGQIEQDADVVIFVYRDEVYNDSDNNPKRGTADILIRKHREGATGRFPMAFLKSYQRFEDLAYEK